jgi:hypothetical protein
MTATGIVLLPIELVALLLPWRWVIFVLPATTIFPASAVLATGSLGLQPGYAMAVFVVMRVMLEASLGRCRAPFALVPSITSLLSFILITVVSLWVAVLFFQEKVLVVGGSDDFQLSAAAPWVFRRENMTQLVYLGLNASFALALGLSLCRLPPDELARAIDRGFIAMIVLADLLCLWQQASFVTGMWWPKEFFTSNPGYADAGGQVMLGGLRVNGPFSEPSEVAFYYAGFVFYGWAKLRARASMSSAALVVSCVAILLISKSTTALAVLGAFALVALLQTAISLGAGRSLLRPTRGGLAATALIAATLAAGVAWALANWTYLSDLLNLLVFQKDQGISYLERSGVNSLALDVVRQTWGLGIGIGSHKADSLALTLLSNTGVFGAATFAIFVVLLLRGTPASRATDMPVRWFVGGLVFVHLFSNPNLSMAVTWMGFGLAMATSGSSAAFARNGAAEGSRWQPQISVRGWAELSASAELGLRRHRVSPVEAP